MSVAEKMRRSQTAATNKRMRILAQEAAEFKAKVWTLADGGAVHFKKCLNPRIGQRPGIEDRSGLFRRNRRRMERGAAGNQSDANRGRATMCVFERHKILPARINAGGLHHADANLAFWLALDGNRRKEEGEACAFADLALDFHRAAMQGHDGFDDGQAEARAVGML